MLIYISPINGKSCAMTAVDLFVRLYFVRLLETLQKMVYSDFHEIGKQMVNPNHSPGPGIFVARTFYH